jgi:hypothetical protein
MDYTTHFWRTNVIMEYGRENIFVGNIVNILGTSNIIYYWWEHKNNYRNMSVMGQE